MKKLVKTTLVISTSLIIGCGSKEESKKETVGEGLFASQDIVDFTGVSNLNTVGPIVPQELKDEFCAHVNKLPLKADFSVEIGVLCVDGKPSTDFENFERLAQVSGSNARPVKLFTQHNGNETHSMFGTAIYVPMEPKWVRNEPIQSYMTTDSFYDYVTLTGSIKSDLNSELGGDLQFAKYALNYKTDIDTQDGNRILNERNTQFNSYQVQGGNPDIGFGGEHLIDENNPDYKLYNTITLTIADGKGGSLMFSIVQVRADNRGYPTITERSISDIAAAQANHIYTGVNASAAAKGGSK